VPSLDDLAELRFGWGNAGWSADLVYIQQMARRAATVEGPILECGSGLTTLVLGLVAGRRGVPVWSMEHHAEWHARMASVLARLRLSTDLRLVPMNDYGEYTWYAPPREEMPTDFALVICDGPPGDTPGGRYGLLPVMREHLAPGAVVLLDDASRPEEVAVLRRWGEEAGARHDFIGESDASAVVTFP